MWHEHHFKENILAKKEKARLFFEQMVNNFISDLNKTRVKSGIAEFTPEEVEKIRPKIVKILQETIKENNL